MTGNVLEWMARNDSEEYPYGLRGGSWDYFDPGNLRAACRYDYGPDARNDDVGFRVGAPAPQDSK